MIISKTPLRVSIVGGGTDMSQFYHNSKGQVISFAIDKYIYVTVKERFDDLIVLNYTQHEVVGSVDEIKHDLIRECCKITGITKSIEISTIADIPSQGSGLGSSSVVTVGLLNALYAHRGIQINQEDLAQLACKVEIDILNKPIGKQDQYIAAYGGFKKFVFNKDESVDIHDFCFDKGKLLKIGSTLLLHFTDQTRNANEILKKQTDNVESKLVELEKIASLVDELEVGLLENDYDIIGELLKKNWEIKKTLALGITSENIDNMVNIAMNNAAIGCKIAGAGGGGFLFSYVNRDLQNKYRNAMASFRELPFMIDPFGSRIIFNIS
jgi:D-glycero-alpha-D-manno-heptose-7-phosphate kinase